MSKMRAMPRSLGGHRPTGEDRFVDEVEVMRSGRCVILSISTDVRIPMGVSAIISLSNGDEAIEVADLFVQEASNWEISAFNVEGFQRMSRRCRADDLSSGLSRGEHPMLDQIPSGGQISLEMTYTGPRAHCLLRGCVIGRIRAERDDSLSVSRSGEVNTVPVWADDDVPIGTGSALITETVRHPMLVESIAVQDAKDWVIHDLRIDGRSQFVRSGDVPAAALARVSELGLNFEIARGEIQFWVSRVGNTRVGDGSARFLCEVAGHPTVA